MMSCGNHGPVLFGLKPGKPGKAFGRRHRVTSGTTSVGEFVTIPRLLARNVAQFGGKPAYRVKEFGIWQSWTWAEVGAEVNALALGLLKMGLNEGDHVAIVGTNRPHFYWAMVAIQSCGAVPVPLYQDAVAEEMAYVLDHCSARFVFAEDQEQVDKCLDVKDQLPGLEQIIFLDPRGMRKYGREHLHDYTEVQEAGRNSGWRAR